MIKNLIKQINKSVIFYPQRHFCQEVDKIKRQKEQEIADILKLELQATFVYVQDTTVGGSCGQMYKMTVESPLFQDRTRVEQHQMVTNALKEILKEVHGFNLKTRLPNQQIQNDNN